MERKHSLMGPRPRVVTAAAVALIVMGLAGLSISLYTVYTVHNLLADEALAPMAELFKTFDRLQRETAWLPLPRTVHVAISVLGSLTLVTAGTFVLRGQNWARLTALVWGAAAALYIFLSLAGAAPWPLIGILMLQHTAVVALIGAALFNRSAGRWFTCAD